VDEKKIEIKKKKIGKEILIIQPVIEGEKEETEVIAVHQAFLGQSWQV
jgi:hypothetical protein